MSILAEVFGKAGWHVRPEPSGPRAPDMLVRRGDASYAIEVKTAAEGRVDRLIPLWSQACLQASRVAGTKHAPLAVVAAPQIPAATAEQVLKFAAEYAPDAAAGVVDFGGLRILRGPHLEGLDAYPSPSSLKAAATAADAPNLFSDLNQWMLKVLLAPEIPDKWLSAPRGQYRNASQVARAAGVSVMSAYRFLQQLEHEGYIESKPYLSLVRRQDLFRRWQSAASARPVSEVSMRFLLRGNSKKGLHRMLLSGRACLGLFAAANALGLGFVEGVPPHVYVRRVNPAGLAAWKSVLPSQSGEAPDLILRKAVFPRSVFNGLVRINDEPVTDALQVWLDVASHPARGAEQANLIERRLIHRLIGDRIGG